MRASIALLVAGAASVFAQGSISSLPACGQTCISNMLAKAPSLGCSSSNATCLCENPDFGYGVRDCSVQYCQNTTASDITIAFGEAYCKQALSGGSGGTSTGGSGTTSTGGAGGGKQTASLPITTEPLTTVITTGGSTITSTTGSTTIYAIGGKTTETLFSTYTSGGKTYTTATATTVIGASQAASSHTSVTGIATTHQKSTIVSGGKTKTKTGGKTTISGAGVSSSSTGGSGGSGGSSTGGSGATSSTGSGAGVPLATMAPGLIGAAAFALLAL